MSDWRRPCAKADAPRLRTDIRGAFADRVPIDWTALAARARSARDRAAIEDLRYLDRLRLRAREDGSAAEASSQRFVFLRGLIAIASLQIVFGLTAVAGGWLAGQSLGPLVPRLLLTFAFGGGSLLLAAASPRDTRCLFLSATLLFDASAFVHEAPAALGLVWPAPFGVISRGLFPEAFAPAALWQFASAFPSVRRFTASDTFARRATTVAWALGSVLFVINIALAYGLADTEAAVRLGRNHANNLFWHLFAVLSLPALATIFIRARRSSGSERRKTRRFASAIVAGGTPFVLFGVARMAWPPLDAWLATADPPERLWLDALIVGTLASVPVRTTLAVIVDRPFDDRLPLPARLHWRRPRRGLPTSVSGRSLRRAESRERVSAALERLGRARGTRELVAILRRELQFGVGAAAVRIVDPPSLPAGTALLPMLEESTGLLDVSPEGELLALMPQRDREWLEAHGVAVAAALKRRDDVVAAVVALGPKSDGSRFGRVDRWFISTVLGGAALAWDSFDAWAGSPGAPDEPALECPACGIVVDQGPLPCACGRDAEPAALPVRLAGKFDVVRRLGSGGMGVVYLARDAVLDRDVALKTLPELRDGTVSRLTAEARAMAALNHDALATIYGVEFWRRTPVLAMEHFPNGTLAERLARGAMSPAEAVTMAQRLAGALAYMHARGVLHRDVKPSNIGLTESGAAKLLDFGLTTERQPFAGTPEYLPPEVLRGEAPSSAIDLWGLSTVLLKACGTRAPLPAPLAAFFDRALSSDTGLRFQTAEEFRGALARVAEDLDAAHTDRQHAAREVEPRTPQ